MRPASTPPYTEEQGAAVLAEFFGHNDAETVQKLFTNSDLLQRVPDPAVRAALLLLSGGPADSLLHAFLTGEAAIEHLGVGVVSGEGRVIGSEVGNADPLRRVLNQRYKSEHPAAIAPSIAHALCHHGDAACNAEEASLHGVLAAVHIWLLASKPSLSTMPTELFRRQASLSITLLNARSPGSWLASIRCEDGPGTIPDGNPALQGPDLWSIPFSSTPSEDCNLKIPFAVQQALASLASDTADSVPEQYSEELGCWLSKNLGQGRFFGAVPRAEAGLALGLHNRGDTSAASTTQ